MPTCDAHPFDVSAGTCRACKQDFCAECLVYAFGPKKAPFCVPCALEAAGIRKGPKRVRDSVASG
jgi:hypothetical protein